MDPQPEDYPSRLKFNQPLKTFKAVHENLSMNSFFVLSRFKRDVYSVLEMSMRGPLPHIFKCEM